MDRYVVVGNPVAHSLSPAIHALFAHQLGDAIEYGRMPVAEGEFTSRMRAFFGEGGRGANVTLPFKGDAFDFASVRSARATLAGAANFLAARDGAIHADNTDGAGLVADLTRNLGVSLAGARILLLGAGGAARGVIAPLLECAPEALVVANRGRERANELARRFEAHGLVRASGLEDIPTEAFDLIINATSASTRGEAFALREALFTERSFAYDRAYGAGARAFVAYARAHGARAADGLGMLVEQAAESFALWRGKRPDTAPVLARLRQQGA
jgi:shikimate dehydrogenase